MKKIIIAGLLLCGFAASAQVKVGNNPTNIDASAELEVASTNKGFLPPRMTTAQRNAIANPAIGLVIFNTNTNCLNFFVGMAWAEACMMTKITGGALVTLPQAPYSNTDPFSNQSECTDVPISVTPCSKVSTAIYVASYDDPTTIGIEYNWLENDSNKWMPGGGTSSLVEINGQCWYARNAHNEPIKPPSNPNKPEHMMHPGANNSNMWGRLYSYKAVIDESVSFPIQGVCAPGFHVPNVCEVKFLEYSLGMPLTGSVTKGSYRGSAQNIGAKLSHPAGAVAYQGDENVRNLSGFAAQLSGLYSDLLTPIGFKNTDEIFTMYAVSNTVRSVQGYFAISKTESGVRYDSGYIHYRSVRCLAD